MQITQESGYASGDCDDEIHRCCYCGAGDDFQVAVLAHVAQRTDTFVTSLVRVVDARRAKAATRTPFGAFVHISARTSIFGLTFGTAV